MSEEVIFHADDACVAVGISVLDLLADGAYAVIVKRDGSGGYTANAGEYAALEAVAEAAEELVERGENQHTWRKLVAALRAREVLK